MTKLFPEGYFENEEYKTNLCYDQLVAIIDYAECLKKYKQIHDALEEEYGVDDRQFKISDIHDPSPSTALLLDEFMRLNIKMSELEKKGLGESFVPSLTYLMNKSKRD